MYGNDDLINFGGAIALSRFHVCKCYIYVSRIENNIIENI